MRTSLQIAWKHAGTYVFWKLLAHEDSGVDLGGHPCNYFKLPSVTFHHKSTECWKMELIVRLGYP